MPKSKVCRRPAIEIDQFVISSDNLTMKLIATLSITAAMVVHAFLGCCAHHEHHSAALYESLDAHQACHCHDDPPCGSEESPRVPQDCDEENCVFVASQHNDFHSIYWAGLPSLVAISDCYDLDFLHSVFSRRTSEDAPCPPGPALHVWQCVWVI